MFGVPGACISVDGCLRDEAVGERDVENTSDGTGDAEEEEVPMKAGGLLQRKVACLCGERGDVVIIVLGPLARDVCNAENSRLTKRTVIRRP